MQNSMFFAVLRLIFALKTKITPPNENSPPKVEVEVSVSFHEYLFFFLRSLDFEQKNALNFGEDLFFFEDHLFLGRKSL